MLRSHMAAVENHLLSISKIPANAGHSLHKGTPREAFIREFLDSHLSERVAIGSGEIIDSDSRPGQKRNQIDIVIYKRDYPKLDFGGGINGFLAESVVATIEVKSILDKAAIKQGVQTARTIKSLKKSLVTSFHTGYQPPSILSYVVGYDGPNQVDSLHKWIAEVHQEESVVNPVMGNTLKDRIAMASPSVDGVFLLGRGFVYFDNVPIGFITDAVRNQHPDIRWMIADSVDGNILLLFTFLTQAVSGVSGSWLNPIPYLSSFDVRNARFGKW
jgi:hypothetical protein